MAEAGSQSVEPEYDIGAGIHDITGPAADHEMIGYVALQLTAGIHMRLWSRAFIVVSRASGKRVVFASADLGMLFQAVKQKWRDGGIAIGGWLSIPSSSSAEVMAHQGFDWLCVDTQHGAIDFTAALPMLQAISTTETMPFVRVPWNEPSIIMKYLDAGAYGIIVPMISTRADVEAVVRACRYPPDGFRSSGPFRASYYGGADYLTEANAEVACVVMIETAEALPNLDEIVSVPGIDVAYIGPSDLSQALGLGGRYDAFNPRHAAAVERIRKACEQHGIVPGIHTSGSGLSAHYAKEGFKMILLTTDMAGVVSGARSELDVMHKAVEELGREPSRP